MYKTLYSALIILALSSLSAQAKHDDDDHGYRDKHSEYHHHGKKHRDKKYHHKHGWKKHHRDDYGLTKKQVKKLIRQGWTPPGWHKRYHRGDILQHDIYRRAKVLARDKGTVRIEVDRTIIHLVHDTREILSILSR
ncbi:hypothetical protein [Pseudoalteromonas sp.]|uniref:hypothetical protein n=1 Tax=Pseudoalteromonas sp. TaxID=53249 RepID=UPI00356799FE